MTEKNPPIFLQNGSHDASSFRRALMAISGGGEGVVESTGMIVQEADTPNMTVDVTNGSALILGDETTWQGVYYVDNQGVKTLTVPSSDSSNPRKDIVVARIRDSQYSGATDSFAIEVISGAASGSPTAPSVPDNAVLLATIDVAANATQITDADIATSDRERFKFQFSGGVEVTNGIAQFNGGVDTNKNSGTGHAQFGGDGGNNIGIDGNEIVARDGDGNAAILYFQNEGGEVSIGGAVDAKVTVNDDLLFVDPEYDGVAIGSTFTQFFKFKVIESRNQTNARFYNTNAAFDNAVVQVLTDRTSDSDFSLLTATTGGPFGSGGDNQFRLRGDGIGLADGAWTATGADYAEYFYSTDGTDIPVGTSVVLVGENVRAAVSPEVPIGVVRPAPGTGVSSSVIGNMPMTDPAKYQVNAYGEYILDGNGDRIENPPESWDDDYATRDQLTGWNLIGLLGVVPITNGQETASSWIELTTSNTTANRWLIR